MKGDVVLALASREPDVSVKLLRRSLDGLPPNVHVRVDIFSNQEKIHHQVLEEIGVQVVTHHGRIDAGYWGEFVGGRDVLICGPAGFGDSVQENLRAVGVPADRIRREGFY